MHWVAILGLASVSGTVYLRQSGEQRPEAGARIAARAASGGVPLASAVSDAQGRYRLDGLPPKRVVVSAAKPGFFSLAAASGEPGLVLDLAGGLAAGGADFEIARGGVITGRITDPWGDPLDRAPVLAWRLADPEGRHRDHPVAAQSDDRGVYRVFGLAPGRYVLEVLPPEDEERDQHAPPVRFPGTIELAAGQETPGIDVALRPERLFEVRGRIVDTTPQELARARLRIQWVRDTPGAPSAGAPVAEDGSFVLPLLPAGSYVVSVVGPGRNLARQIIELRENQSDLVLRPSPSGEIAGRVMIAGRGRPPEVRLEALDRTRQQTYRLAAPAPDYRFAVKQVWADTYSLRAEVPSGAYLLADTEVVVPPGGVAEVEVKVGLEPGRVAGLAKAAGGRPLAHARVGLARWEGGRLQVRTEQADQTAASTSPISGRASTGSAPGRAAIGRSSIRREPGSRPARQSGASPSSRALRSKSS